MPRTRNPRASDETTPVGLSLSARGELRLDRSAALPAGECLPSRHAAAVHRAFRGGLGAGLLHLASKELQATLCPSLAFGRALARSYLTALRRQGDAAGQQALEPPAEELAGLLDALPPLVGARPACAARSWSPRSWYIQSTKLTHIWVPSDISLYYAMAGLHPTSRERLEKLHRAFHGPFRIPDAAEALALSERQARRFLARLAASAWLVRLKPGLYATVPLGAGEQGDWQEDPWRLAGKLYAPCYVAGWSACEHWGLTEQVFRSIVVVTAKQVRAPEEVVQGTTFRLKHLDEKRIFGTATAWRGRAPVQVSDPARTILDALAFPVLCGGIRHVSEVLETYMQSSMRDDDLLLDYAERFGNRSVYKRLGYLLEQLAIDAPRVIAACTARMSTGVVPLDPSGPSDGRITSRWRLKVNVRITSDGEDR